MKKNNILLLLVVFFSLTISAQKTQKVTLLATNDIHSAIDNFAKFEVLADSIEDVNEHFMLISSGDNRTGNPANDAYEKEPSYPIISLMNALGFDATAIGNHEFDGGVANFTRLAELANFPYVCANIEFENKDYQKLVKPYIIRQFGVNGPKIAFLSIVQRNDRTLIPDMHPDNAIGLKFFDEDETILKYKSLKDSADCFILLSHCGIDADTIFAQKYGDLFDVIMGSHTHTAIPSNTFYNNVLITQSRRELKNATEINLEFKDNKLIKRSSILYETKNITPKSARVQYLIDKYNDNPILSKKVGYIKEDLNEKEELGILMGDAFIASTGADIALVNSGSVRFTEYKKGWMTVKDVLCMDPFGNETAVYTLTGAQLKKVLTDAHSADEYGSAFVSGCDYTITLDKKDTHIVKAIQIFVNGKPIKDNQTYKVCSSSYFTSSLGINKITDVVFIGKITAESIQDFLQDKKEVDYSGKKHLTEIIK